MKNIKIARPGDNCGCNNDGTPSCGCISNCCPPPVPTGPQGPQGCPGPAGAIGASGATGPAEI